MQKLFLPVFLLFIASCAAHPEVVNVKDGNEKFFNCQQLHYEMERARQAKVAAHEEDKFRFRYIMPVNGIISIANIWRADSRATKRLEYLQELASQKGCMGQPYDANQPMPQHMPRY